MQSIPNQLCFCVIADRALQVRQRYQQARASSAGRTAARPVSGAFTLDLDAIEGRGSGEEGRLSVTGPKAVCPHSAHAGSN